MDLDGRPQAFLVQTAEKTYATFELTFTNPGGDSSTPRADNAIFDLATAAERLAAYRFPVRTNDATLRYRRARDPLAGGKLGGAMARFAANPEDPAAAEALWNQPSEVGGTRTTCLPTMLRGGHAENALPQSATLRVNCRIFPDINVAEVEAEL